MMTGENNSSENFIKDTTSSITSYGSENVLIQFSSRSNKLITALYLVTDIMDKEEPLRSKLRLAGTDILSDMHIVSYKTDSNLINKNINKISEIVSFLEVAFTVGMISEMNFNVLKKEFFALKESLSKHNNPILIEDFLNSKPNESIPEEYFVTNISKDNNKEKRTENQKEIFKGHESKDIKNRQVNGTRIGVQKGSTLLRALKDIKTSNNKKSVITTVESNKTNKTNKTNFDSLKKERREAILKIIKDKKEATITDIKKSASGLLASCGEKTLQRELISMVNDGVLKKMGEKRWSRYFL